MDNNIDPKFFNQVAQNAHMLGGAVIGLLALLFLPHSLVFIILGFAVVTGVKEFWYDQNYENATTRGSNLNDWIHYQIGWMATGSLYYGVYGSHWWFLGFAACIGLAFVPWITTLGKKP